MQASKEHTHHRAYRPWVYKEKRMYAPYTDCEWNQITHGIKKAKTMAVREYEKIKYEMMMKEIDRKYIFISKDKLILTAMSILPTVMLVVFGISLLSK